MVSKEDLIQFEEAIKGLFLDARIRSPVHLSSGNEEPLIDIFKRIREEDWCFSTHRSHYHALLKGISPDWLRSEILENRSIHIYNKEHNFFSSAIVGGCLPIAVGVAMALKKKGSDSWVWAFCGDMAAETGIFHECTKYAKNFNLPVLFVIEDNDLSVNTPTRETWGINEITLSPIEKVRTLKEWEGGKILYYHYLREFPHAGVGQRVKF